MTIITTVTTRAMPLLPLLALATLLVGSTSVCAYPDFFNFAQTDLRDSTYGPADWDQVDCRNTAHCPGWPTNWDEISDFIPYNANMNNMCRDCARSTTGDCEEHVQSPINLQRSANQVRTCIDAHKMRYWAGECEIDRMKFEVLPHALRVYRPVNPCPGRNQPQLDFSRGFPAPWRYSFTDITVPSQHQLEGRRYAAEVIMAHTYANRDERKLIGNLSILLQEGGPNDQYDFLDLHIQGWLLAAKVANDRCNSRPRARRLSAELDAALEAVGYHVHNTTSVAATVAAAASNNNSSSHSLLESERRLFPLHDPNFHQDTTQPRPVSRWYYDRTWHPYDWYIRANTEYYFRYEGTMPEPPCIAGVHWRVLKDPIRVAPAQIRALEQLLIRRHDPITCERNTAGTVTGSRIAVNRPLQTTRQQHKLVYCECNDWRSSSEKDLDHCRQSARDRGVFTCRGRLC